MTCRTCMIIDLFTPKGLYCYVCRSMSNGVMSKIDQIHILFCNAMSNLVANVVKIVETSCKHTCTHSCRPHADLLQTSCRFSIRKKFWKPRANLVQSSSRPYHANPMLPRAREHLSKRVDDRPWHFYDK